MVLIRGLLIVGAISLWVGCVFDVIRSDGERVHHIHRLVWLALVVLVPTVGSLAWLLLGRPNPLGSRIGERKPSVPPPDDSPEFLASLDEEIRRRRRAQELRGNPQEKPEPDRKEIDEEIRRLEKELGDEFGSTKDPDEEP